MQNNTTRWFDKCDKNYENFGFTASYEARYLQLPLVHLSVVMIMWDKLICLDDCIQNRQ